MRNFMYHFFLGRYGSYGIDRLTKFLLTVAIALLVVSLLISPLSFMYYVAFLVIAYAYYRLMSKKITRRYKENEFYSRLEYKLLSLLKRKS